MYHLLLVLLLHELFYLGQCVLDEGEHGPVPLGARLHDAVEVDAGDEPHALLARGGAEVVQEPIRHELDVPLVVHQRRVHAVDVAVHPQEVLQVPQ